MDLVGEGPCERVVVFMVSMVFVCLDSCRFNKKGNRKRGIGIFKVFSYIYHRVLFWKGFPISMDKLLHHYGENASKNAAIISCMIFIMMGSSWIFKNQPVLLDFAHPQQGLATSQLSDLPWAEAFEASRRILAEVVFLNLKRERVTKNAPTKVQEVALQTATESQLQKYYSI